MSHWLDVFITFMASGGSQILSGPFRYDYSFKAKGVKLDSKEAYETLRYYRREGLDRFVDNLSNKVGSQEAWDFALEVDNAYDFLPRINKTLVYMHNAFEDPYLPSVFS